MVQKWHSAFQGFVFEGHVARPNGAQRRIFVKGVQFRVAIPHTHLRADTMNTSRKSKVGLITAKAAALRVKMNTASLMYLV